MGDNKLLLPFQDNTLINVVCKTIIDSYLKPVFVVTGFENKKVLESLPKSIDKIVYNEDWSRGMATSINKAISSLPNNIDGNMIVLGDMPLGTVKTINNLHQVFLNNYLSFNIILSINRTSLIFTANDNSASDSIF